MTYTRDRLDHPHAHVRLHAAAAAAMLRAWRQREQRRAAQNEPWQHFRNLPCSCRAAVRRGEPPVSCAQLQICVWSMACIVQVPRAAVQRSAAEDVHTLRPVNSLTRQHTDLAYCKCDYVCRLMRLPMGWRQLVPRPLIH
jgi:hypothetical protein